MYARIPENEKKIISYYVLHVNSVRDKVYFVIWPKSNFFFENGTLSINKTLRGGWGDYY
jgi:hypothetical protein